MTLAPGIAGRMRGLRGAVANRPCGCHPAAAALFAGSVPAVVALDDDDAAALTARCRLDEFTPQERRTQQCKTLEVDVDFGQVLLDVIMDVAQPLTDFEPVGADRRGTSSGVDQVVEHEERGKCRGFEPTIRTCDEALDPPGGGAPVPGVCRNVELASHRTNPASRDTGESCDDPRAHLAAQQAFGKRERADLAVDDVLGEGGFHGAARWAEQYAACAQKSCAETAANRQIWMLTQGLHACTLPLFCG